MTEKLETKTLFCLQIMSRGKPSPRGKTLPNETILTGLSTATFTAIIPRFYRSAGGVSTKPSRVLAAILTPPIFGSITALSWHLLVSSPIRQQRLKCVSCASVKGAVIVVFNGCLVPSAVVALLHFKRNASLQKPVFTAFVDFCYAPYYGRYKLYLIGLTVFQVVLGYGLAGWVYSEELINRKNIASRVAISHKLANNENFKKCISDRKKK